MCTLEVCTEQTMIYIFPPVIFKYLNFNPPITLQIASCELLHAVVLYVVGRGAQPGATKKVHEIRTQQIIFVCLPVCLFTCLLVYLLFVCFYVLTYDQYPMTKVYQKLFPVILQLACDVERVRKNCAASVYILMKHIVTFFSGQEYVESV